MARAILTYRAAGEAIAFDCRAPMRHIPPMQLGYFTMPLHPPHRDPAQTLQEDREAIVLADRLGFHDAFVGEHLTDRCENVTSGLIFLATLIGETKTIKLATGTSNLSQSHPVVIAAQAAMFDHLARGRFIFGVSPGALSSDAEALGILAEDRNRMFAEAIDVILAIWERDAPYGIDLQGNRYKVTTEKTFVPEIGRGIMYRPYQKPRPEIVGTVVAPHSKGVIAMGERRRRQAARREESRSRAVAHCTDDLRRRRRPGRRALRARGSFQPLPFLLEAAAREDDARRASGHLQAARERGRRRGDARAAAGGARSLRDGQQGRGRAPRAARALGRLRRNRLRRDGLGGLGARAPLDGADGERSDAADQQGDRRAGEGAAARGGADLNQPVREQFLRPSALWEPPEPGPDGAP